MRCSVCTYDVIAPCADKAEAADCDCPNAYGHVWPPWKGQETVPSKKLPELIVTKDGVPFKDQAEGIRQFKEACCAPTSPVARPIDEYHDDMGDVLWWSFPIEEPPYVGSPNDVGYPVEHCIRFITGGEVVEKRHTVYVGGWPGYHTHFTTFEVPVKPQSMTLADFLTKAIGNRADKVREWVQTGTNADAKNCGAQLYLIQRWITRGGIKL